MGQGMQFNPAPGWPAPPVGFRPQPGWQPDSSWAPAPEGWRLWVAVRCTGVRLFMFFGIIGGFFAAQVAVGAAIASSVRPEDYPTYEAYSSAVDDALSTATGGFLLAAFVGLALIARKVSYRWFDAFLVVIPLVGIFFVCRFLWRFTLLPVRDWDLRPDESAMSTPAANALPATWERSSV